MGTLDYFATLPIIRFTLILAMVLSFLLLLLSSLIVTIGVGALVLALPLQISPLLIPAVHLCAVPLSGIGAIIAANARAPEEGKALNLLVTFVLLGPGPVVFPASRLPGFVLALGHFSPATYAASALRQTLLGPGDLGACA